MKSIRQIVEVLMMIVVLLFSFPTAAPGQDVAQKVADFLKKSPGQRLKAVAKITDQELLAGIVKQDQDTDVQAKAVERITDEHMLADIAKTRYEGDEKTWRSWDVRQEAAKKIHDPALLKDVAEGASSSYVRDVAVERIFDQTALAKIATSAARGETRLAALKNLSDQAVLAQVGRTDAEPLVRAAAVEKVTDQAVLTHVARADVMEGVRKAALKRISDPAVAADIARENAARPAVRGVRWGMSKAEVLEAVGHQPVENAKGDLELPDTGVFEPEKDARVTFGFSHGKLQMVAYSLPETLRAELFARLTFVSTRHDLVDHYGEPDQESSTAEAKMERWQRGPLGDITHTLVIAGQTYVHLVVYTAPGVMR